MNNRIKKTLKIIGIVIAFFFVLWTLMLATDYWRTTHNFKKPIFARCTKGVDDGGSGTYRGIGYSVEIAGNFMPEEQLKGVTYSQFMIFGREVKEVNRD